MASIIIIGYGLIILNTRKDLDLSAFPIIKLDPASLQNRTECPTSAAGREDRQCLQKRGTIEITSWLCNSWCTSSKKIFVEVFEFLSFSLS